MERGEVWLAEIWAAGQEWPVVLLAGAEPAPAMQIVAPATEEQKRGFIVLTPEEAADEEHRARAAASPRVAGIEVPVEELGVVRVALPQHDRIFCTWQVSVERSALIRRVAVLSSETMSRLDLAVELAGLPLP